jgi:hypothetical protein
MSDDGASLGGYPWDISMGRRAPPLGPGGAICPEVGVDPAPALALQSRSPNPLEPLYPLGEAIDGFNPTACKSSTPASIHTLHG